MDLLIINCPSHQQVYQALHNDKLTALEPPIWAGLIANFIREKGHSVSILDAQAERLTFEETGNRIINASPQLALFVVYGHQPSASTQCMPAAIDVCRLVKSSSNVPVMFMGTHPAALPQRTLEESGADFACTGEGPFTVLKLLKVLKSGSSKVDLCGDLSYLDDKNLISTNRVPLISDLSNTLPKVAWDLLPMDRYRAHNWHCLGGLDRQPYASLYTSLGCPYRCSFCCINVVFGKPTIRYWDISSIINEIEILIEKYGIRNLKIIDELFVLNKRHISRFCDAIIERGYDLNMWVYARIDTVPYDLLDKMRMAGIRWLAFGIESASPIVCSESGKQIKVDTFDVVNKVKAHDINVMGNYIFGLPRETKETMQQTLDLALELNTEWANFYCAMAYPGSRLHIEAQGNIPLPEDPGGPGWVGYSQHAYETFPLRTDHLLNSEILAFRDKAHVQYFTNDRFLQLIELKFGKETMQVVEQMNKSHLSRKYSE
ncbi:hypothetical protein LCGC14_1008290 [marine sediment metagenome]|uniref:Uncharacterized protein n=1 Tax=marine sediment metagenome TaxID=412755 RepID=A0A0F9N150_9ZZZZ